MTKLQFALLSFAAIVVAGALLVFVPAMKETALGLAGLGILGVGYVMRSQWDKAELEAARTTESTTTTVTSVQPTVEVMPPSDKGSVRLGLAIGLAFGAALLMTLFALPVRADTSPQVSWCEGRYCVQPATAVGWVVNLKTGDVANASILAGVSVVRSGGIALGAGLYGGSVLSPSGARPTLAALFSVANFGAIGPGVVMFKDGERVVYQMTLGLSLNLNFGGSPTYVRETAAAKGTP